jgi:hypothetical protein
VSQKLLVVLLVVIVVLFVVTIALGASHGPRSPDDSDPDGIGFLNGLQGQRFLRLGDKATTTCQTSDQITLNVPAGAEGCTVTVGKRSIFSRPIRVAFDTAGPVSVKVESKTVPGKEQAVDGGKCFASAVEHGGGTITLTAPFATTIAIRTAKCDDAGS